MEDPRVFPLGHRHLDEKTYNRRRRQRGLGRLTPVEYEAIYSVAKAA